MFESLRSKHALLSVISQEAVWAKTALLSLNCTEKKAPYECLSKSNDGRCYWNFGVCSHTYFDDFVKGQCHNEFPQFFCPKFALGISKYAAYKRTAYRPQPDDIE